MCIQTLFCLSVLLLCEPILFCGAPWKTGTKTKTAAEDEKDRLSNLGVSIFLEAFASCPLTLPTTPKKRASLESTSVEPATTGSVCHGNTQVSFLARLFCYALGGRGLSRNEFFFFHDLHESYYGQKRESKTRKKNVIYEGSSCPS